MKYVLFVLVVGTVTVALVIDLIVLFGWLRRAAMNAFAAIGKKQFADRKGRSCGGVEVYVRDKNGRKTQQNQHMPYRELRDDRRICARTIQQTCGFLATA
jgi:hypothetical protein